MKKKRHHFVWQEYLSSWTNDSKIFCKRNNKIFHTNTTNVAVQNHFYVLQELSFSDIDLIKKVFIEPLPPDYKYINRNIIKNFTELFQINHISKIIAPDDKKIAEEINTEIHNQLEDFHSTVEYSVIEILKEIKESRSLEVLSNEEFLSTFLSYLCTQYFRTKRMEQNIINSIDSNIYNLKNIWKIGSFILANNMSYTLFLKRREYEFLLLESTVNYFITGDQPVLNTYFNFKDNDYHEDRGLELFYPLSPTLALLITLDKTKKNSTKLNEKETIKYNKAINNAALEQIFGLNKESLENL